MSGTLIVAARQAVITGVDALPAFDRVLCSLSYKADSRAREMLYTADARFEQEPASLRAGRTHRQETGTFAVVIRIEGIGKDQAYTSDRAVDLGVALEEWVADNRIPAGSGLQWLVAKGRGALDERFNDNGTLARLIYTFEYSARLT